jgi:hypothetical protein
MQLILRIVSMLNIRSITQCLILGSLLTPICSLAETYTISPNPPTSATVNLDTDGVFTVVVSSSLWTQCCGPITKRYGVLRERRILPNGTVQTYSHNVTAGLTSTFTGRLSGTTEFYEIKHCYEYLSNPAYDQCYTSPAYLTIQSFPPQNQLTTTNSAPPPADPDGGHVNCVGPQC